MDTTPPPPPHTGLFINGVERQATSRLEVVDPARPGVVVGTAAAATEADVADAVAAAKLAFTGWSAFSTHERASALLDAISADDDEAMEEDARILSLENGKILREARRDVSMLRRRVHQTAPLADEVATGRTYDADADNPVNTYVEYQPLGVVTIIVPFNWPIGILSTALPHALLAGNTVIVKPAPSAPLATTRVVQRFAAKLPPGVVNVVTGRDSEMTQLIQNPDIAKVCFTGSVAAGRRIMQMAAQTLTRVTLELGGNDAAIFLEDAMLDDTHLDRLHAATFDTAGQICMNAKRVYVHRSRLSELVEGLSARLARTVIGHGLDATTTMGPLHSRRQKEFVHELIAEATASGADVHEFGELPAGDLTDGHFLRPAIVVDPDPSLRIVTEEPFGPAIPIIPFDDENEAIAAANDSWAGLGGSVWTADPDAAKRIASQLVCGYVWVNDHGAPRLDIRAPFGGMKQSGIGREQGIDGVRAFQDTRAIAVIEDRTLAQ